MEENKTLMVENKLVHLTTDATGKRRAYVRAADIVAVEEVADATVVHLRTGQALRCHDAALAVAQQLSSRC